MMPDTDRPACPRGPLCAGATPVYGTDGARATRHPAPLDQGAALCGPDRVRAARTLADLPELVARLDLEHLPRLSIRYDIDPVSSGGHAAPVPINDAADGVTRLIDSELWHWGDIVATAAGLRAAGEWSGLWSTMSRPGHRIQTAATLLTHRLDLWLGLPPMRYPAQSLTCDPADAPLPGRLVWDDGWWIERSGAQAACVLMDLAGHAERITGRVRPLWTPGTCTYPPCGKPELYRHPQLGTVVCRACGNSKTLERYRAFSEAALAALAALDSTEATEEAS